MKDTLPQGAQQSGCSVTAASGMGGLVRGAGVWLDKEMSGRRAYSHVHHCQHVTAF